MTDAKLIETWRAHLSSGAAGLHLVDAEHPLQMFVGATDNGAPRIVIRSSAKPSKPGLSNVVLVDRYEDQGGKWNLSFTLQDRKFDEVFLRLADDVHARSASSINEPTALDRVDTVIEEWRRLLKPRSTGLLTMEELRGLIGELWLLLNRFSTIRPIDASVEGWLGPLGLPQDFWFADEGYREAKAIGPSTNRVRISSEHQLDAEDLRLIVLRVASTDEQAEGAVNLPKLVTRVYAALADIGANKEGFTARLARLGVELSETFYQDTWFVVNSVTDYQVTEGFPLIAASALPTGVARVMYQIETVALEPFKISDLEVP